MKNTFTILFLLFGLTLSAQDIGFGFRAGLNFNSFQGDSETDGGVDLEEYTNNTGFHVGATFTWKATDLMGLRGELLYNQKGSRWKYEGASYYDLVTSSGTRIPTTGNRNQSLNLTTSYIDLPVTGYFKPVEQVEIFVGVSLGFLVATSTFGELNYSDGRTNAGVNFETFRYEIDGSYIGDEPGEGSFETPPKTVSIGGGATAELPNSAGVYYEFTEDLGNLYKAIDIGGIAGISFYLNGSLFVSGRVNYGLNDITKEAADVSLRSKNGDAFITRNDKDRNFAIQASIGFSF